MHVSMYDIWLLGTMTLRTTIYFLYYIVLYCFHVWIKQSKKEVLERFIAQSICHWITLSGVAFVKMAQSLSTRAHCGDNVFPSFVLQELRQLQTSMVPHLSIQEINQLVHQSFPQEGPLWIQKIHDPPLGTGCSGQVHRVDLCYYKNNQDKTQIETMEAALKIRNKHLSLQTTYSFCLIRGLLSLCRWVFPRSHPIGILASEHSVYVALSRLEKTMHDQDDILKEVDHQKKAFLEMRKRVNMACQVPRVFPLVTDQLFVMECLPPTACVPFQTSLRQAIVEQGIPYQHIADQVANICITLFFEDKMLDMDLHEGNIALHVCPAHDVEPALQNKYKQGFCLYVLDWALVPEYTEEERKLMVRLAGHAMCNNVTGTFRTLVTATNVFKTTHPATDKEWEAYFAHIEQACREFCGASEKDRSWKLMASKITLAMGRCFELAPYMQDFFVYLQNIEGILCSILKQGGQTHINAISYLQDYIQREYKEYFYSFVEKQTHKETQELQQQLYTTHPIWSNYHKRGLYDSNICGVIPVTPASLNNSSNEL